MKDGEESDENIARGQNENKEIITLSGGIILKTLDIYLFKETVSTISSEPPCTDGNAGFTLVPLNYILILKTF